MISKNELFERSLTLGIQWPPAVHSAKYYMTERHKARKLVLRRYVCCVSLIAILVGIALMTGIINFFSEEGTPFAWAKIYSFLFSLILLYPVIRILSPEAISDSPYDLADIELRLRCQALNVSMADVPVFDTQQEYQAWKEEYECYREQRSAVLGRYAGLQLEMR